MRRREFISLLSGAAALPLLLRPLVARAQSGPARRVGVLLPLAENDSEGLARIRVLKERLQQLGWTEGQNLQLFVRFAGSAENRIRAHASELVAAAPDVILVNSNPGLAAVMRETRTIPTVFTQVADPVGSNFVASLARPGGNVTGFTNFETPMGGKWLEGLKEIAPDLKRAAVLLHPDTAANIALLRAAEAASSAMQMAVVAVPVHNAADIERAIMELAREPNGGVIALPHVVTTEHRELIARLSLQQRLPLIGAFRFMATSGALLSYGIDAMDLNRRACAYVDRILRGEKPADLPVQAPTKFELVVNLKTAKGLGLTIPESFLLRADEVIE